MIRWLREMGQSWRQARLSRIALGKYIILMASLLHIGWAILLTVNPEAGNSTPVHILVVTFGGPVRTAVVLGIVSITAMVFPFTRYRVSNRALALMLIPQQVVLLMSAGAGVLAAASGHYADGVVRSQAFILGDQLTTILLAGLYTVAVLEASFES